MKKSIIWLLFATALLFTGCYATSGPYVAKGYPSPGYGDPFGGTYFYPYDGRYPKYGGIYGPSFRFHFRSGYPDHRIYRFKRPYSRYGEYHKPYGYRYHEPYRYKKFKKFHRYDYGSGRRPYHPRSW